MPQGILKICPLLILLVHADNESFNSSLLSSFHLLFAQLIQSYKLYHF